MMPLSVEPHFLEMPLQHDAFECRAAARAAVPNQLEHTDHLFEFTLQSVLVLLAVVFVV